jgi:hypothetical protein
MEARVPHQGGAADPGWLRLVTVDFERESFWIAWEP